MNNFSTRLAHIDDWQTLFELRKNAILEKTSNNYDDNTIKEWAFADGVDWQEKFCDDIENPDVVTLLLLNEDNEAAGFSQTILSTRTLDCLYVPTQSPTSHRPTKNGGEFLLDATEKYLSQTHGVNCLMADATQNAIGFYEKFGWEKISNKPVDRIMDKFEHNGQTIILKLPCFQISKALKP